MAQSGVWAIGVDLGGTKTVVARVNSDGSVEQRIRLMTDVRSGPSGSLAAIIAASRDLRKNIDTPPVAIGVGVAGQIDEERGVVKFAPNLEWRDVPFGNSLSSALDLPAVLTNDVRAATWGEWLHGSGRDCDDVICMFVGTGVGGGVISGGRMITGCTNTAGEIGHMTIQLHGPRCHCRNAGCLEALAGGWAIARSAHDAIQGDPVAGARMLALANGDPGSVTARTVGLAAQSGDPLAQSLIDDVVHALCAGAVALVNAFNPCRLILGGGVIEGMPELVDRIRAGVAASALLTAIDRLQVMPAQLREDAGVIGVAAHALRVAAQGKLGKSAA